MPTPSTSSFSCGPKANPSRKRCSRYLIRRYWSLSQETGHALTDPWCLKLAATHLIAMIESGEDLEKTLVTLSPADLRRAAASWQPV